MKVLITNIPVRGFIEVYVDVPDGLEGDALQEALRDAVSDGDYREKDEISGVEEVEVETDVLESGYELQTEAAPT